MDGVVASGKVPAWLKMGTAYRVPYSSAHMKAPSGRKVV